MAKRATPINQQPPSRRMRSPGGWIACVVLGGLTLVGCIPATTSTTTPASRTVELELVVATDCEAGADMIVTVDGVSHSFPAVEFERTGDQELPLKATVRVPALQGAATYRVIVTKRCDDPRRTSISAFRVDGDDRVALGSSTTAGRSTAVLEGTR